MKVSLLTVFCIAHNAPRYAYYGLNADAVRRLVDETRTHGYALLTGLTIRGVSVVALPVPGSDAQLSVGVAGMTSRFGSDELAAIVSLVRDRLASALCPASSLPEAPQ